MKAHPVPFFTTCWRPASDRVSEVPGRFGIVADDLAGSCDVAGRLTCLGYSPFVQTRADDTKLRFSSLRRFLDEPTALIVNTRSRDCPVREAVSRTRAAAEYLEHTAVPVVYLKVDSTLRGHWAECIEAIARVAQPNHIFICPAFPSRGRFVRDGRLWLDRPVGSQARPKLPSAARLQTILNKRCGWQAREIRLKTIRQGTEAIRAAIIKIKRPCSIVLDAEEENDLAIIGRLRQSLPGRVLWVGSAGLVRYVLLPQCVPKPGPAENPKFAWFLIGGSRNPVTREQFSRLKCHPQTCVFELLLGKNRKQVQAQISTAARALEAGRHVAVLTPEKFNARVTDELSQLVRALLRMLPQGVELGGIFATGGRTAEALCDRLRIRVLRVVGEVRPGIPASRSLDGYLPGLRLVTKAGGFGRADEVREMLQEGFLAR